MNKLEIIENEKTRKTHEEVKDKLLNNLDNCIGMKKLYEIGIGLFGSEEKFELRLKTPNTALGGKTPCSTIETTEGRKNIYAELIRIEHGILA